MRRPLRGYILVETMVAMGVLSISMLTIQQAVREAMLTRAMAEDLTTARFLMEEIMNGLIILPELEEGSSQGDFGAEFSRFSYTWRVSKAEVPRPELPEFVPEQMRESLTRQYKGFIPKVSVTVSWTRLGQQREITAQTLLPPEQLWLPEMDL